MQEVKAPEEIPNDLRFHVFLAGSIEGNIEGNKAEPWQTEIVEALSDLNCVVLNPRRNDWDSSWKTTIENAQFREQVEWELSAQTMADLVAMYFDPTTKSPITLLEFGLFAPTGKLVVCCPTGFWRKGNVDVTAKFIEQTRGVKVRQVADKTALIECIRKTIKLWNPRRKLWPAQCL